ncbi:Hsp20/alpha crystallin family protein [Leptospira mtsangambouensis]|uniref:Hsp20/alpha crystallin family protein n=1 Tax=Leptospira mtsangambouensis TaxID=2484912 RepID=A0ABY2P439_9LEPT|nr:Hsp20/alpha crystallin family protein [Leptospira mtsangambouensis]TGM82108.1 Hsp20/alpha crystallin family protein [Leptospira mtsangambouensis]
MNTLTKENHGNVSETVEGKDQKLTTRVYSPNVDVLETEEAILFFVEMPGVDQSSVDISIEKDQLILEGKFVPVEESRGQVRLAEYREGNYYRKFTIGKAIHSDKATAKMKNGILELTIPKMEPKKTKIEIQK